MNDARVRPGAATALGAALFILLGMEPVHGESISAQPIIVSLSEESLPSAAASPDAAASSSPFAPSQGATPAPTASAPESSATPTGEPGARATDAAPAADLANVPISAPVSSSSLDPLIRQTTDLSLAASLRITEEARQRLGDNRPDEAIRLLGHGLSIDAGNSYAYFYLGRAYLMKKDYKQALTFFSRAEMGLSSNPPWLGETVSFEGACYEEMGREQDAALAYQRAVQLAPGNLMARTGYGRLASALPPPPPPPAEEQPSAENLDQPPPEEEDEVRSVPPGEPLETLPAEKPPPAHGDNDSSN